MALRAVPDHPKFAHLKALLKLGKGATLGYLECMWHFAGRFTPQGNIGKYSDSVIENWVEWQGEPGMLIAAFIEAKWIDADDTHRLLVHDWHQHADKATKNALNRAELDFCTPTVRTSSVQRTDTVPKSGNPSRLPEPEPEPGTLAAAETAAECLSDGGISKESLLSPGVETRLEQVSRRIHVRHPAVRRCGINEVKKQLRAIMRRTSSAKRIELLHRIDQNHAALVLVAGVAERGRPICQGAFELARADKRALERTPTARRWCGW